MSTPCSSAIRRALGDMRDLAPRCGWIGWRCGCRSRSRRRLSSDRACSAIPRGSVVGFDRRLLSGRDEPRDGLAHGHALRLRASCTPASTPSPGASSSTETLSVSISSSGSPLTTLSPSFLSQDEKLPGFLRHLQGRHHHADGHKLARTLPPSRARAGFHHLHHALAGRRIVLARGRQAVRPR